MRLDVVSAGILLAFNVSPDLTRTPDSSAPKANENPYSEAYDDAFRAAGRKAFIENCIASALKAAAAGLDATPTCTCVADALVAAKTIEELKHLGSDQSSVAELATFTARCLKVSPPLAIPKP